MTMKGNKGSANADERPTRSRQDGRPSSDTAKPVATIVADAANEIWELLFGEAKTEEAIRSRGIVGGIIFRAIQQAKAEGGE